MAASPSSSLCQSCRAPVILAKHATTRRAMILDATPIAKEVPGRFAIVAGVAVAYSAEHAAAVPPLPAYVSHFSTCPDSAAWRQRGRR